MGNVMSKHANDIVFESVLSVPDVTADAEVYLAAFKNKNFKKGFFMYFDVSQIKEKSRK